MRKVSVFFVLAIIAVSSCGPSKEEEAQKQKFLVDSVANATKIEIELEQRKNDSISKAENIKDSISIALKDSSEKAQQSLEKEIIELKASLAGEESKLDAIKEFHFGRSSNEKSAQIEDQTKVIEGIKLKIASLEKLQIK